MTRQGGGLKVRIQGFAFDEVLHCPILLLGPEKRDEILPLWIDFPRARAIAHCLDGTPADLPRTFELFAMSLSGLAVRHLCTEITHLDGNTYSARIILRQDREFVTVPCHPEDGIALALCSGGEIFVDKTIFEAQKQGVENFTIGDLPREEQ